MIFLYTFKYDETRNWNNHLSITFLLTTKCVESCICLSWIEIMDIAQILYVIMHLMETVGEGGSCIDMITQNFEKSTYSKNK